MIESSESKDMGICCGLNFLGNTEPPRNLQQTKCNEIEELTTDRWCLVGYMRTGFIAREMR